MPVEQGSRREDLVCCSLYVSKRKTKTKHLLFYSFWLKYVLSFQLTQCLVHILSKALYKTNDTPLHPECKNILTPGTLLCTVHTVLHHCVIEQNI